MFWDENKTPDAEPARVLLKRGEFIDQSRTNEDGTARVVPFKMYHPDHPPAGVEKLPVIIWSHGFGGNRDGASFLSRYLAGHGYILFHITHHGTDSSLWEGKGGHPWDILRQAKVPRSASINRFLDVPFALEQLKIWAQENPEVGEMMDFSCIGMSGHSFGAMTTQVMAGQLFPNEEGALQSMKSDAFKAGILYSPVPIAHLTDASPEELYRPIDIPLLHMTGTDDQSPLEHFGYENRLVIYENTTKADAYLLVKENGDHMVYNGTRGKLDANPYRERHEDLIKISAHAFWDAQLKGNKKAQEWLTEGDFATYMNGDGTFTYKIKS